MSLADKPEPTSKSFLEHAVSNSTQYSEGWRQICQELLDARARIAELEATRHDAVSAALTVATVVPYGLRAHAGADGEFVTLGVEVPVPTGITHTELRTALQALLKLAEKHEP